VLWAWRARLNCPEDNILRFCDSIGGAHPEVVVCAVGRWAEIDCVTRAGLELVLQLCRCEDEGVAAEQLQL
jgi:hypothetical protein